MFAPAYFDYNATTPIDARVLEAMLPWLQARHGNASSRHEYGRAARAAVDEARERVAAAVGAHKSEVVFTSGGSEANNLFIKGVAAGLKPGLIAISAIEHPCVREPARQLRRLGWRVAELGVDAQGTVDPAALDAALDDGAAIVSVMLANNETGTINDVAALAACARGRRAWFHTDAVQALGKMAVNFRALGVHALSVSAHKLGGPQGVGALVVDKRVELQPLIAGGGQERGLRSGTENVAGIVGFGAACEYALADQAERAQRLSGLRDRIEAGLAARGARLFGVNAPARLPNTTFCAFPDIDGETLVAQLDRAGFAVASGSACSSANPEPSHTLLAMGVAPDIAKSAVRVSLGAQTDEAQVERFLLVLDELLRRLQRMAAVAV
ncbi:MAG: cysteine desulfurase [Rhodocyclaceae bacterium]|nr:cysteine desulfurase [Rhodocyclaceae bacterium]